MTRHLAFFSLIAVGCSDYSIYGGDKAPEVPPDLEEEEPPPPEVEEEQPPPVEEPPPPEPAPTCADAVLPVFDWVASTPFAHQDDPPTMDGTPFHQPGALLDWQPVAMPDRGIPIGDDRAYVATFDLSAIPVNLSLNLQSDDGLWVWVNGEYLGNWGGAWQQEGCVNENAECLITTNVAPIDVTDLLTLGENVIAARVSNPVANSYFEIIPECVD